MTPSLMIHSLRKVGRQFRPGRQEDAHEYLIQLLDSMHEEVLKANGVRLCDGKVAESTFVGKIFGGHLCNELRCPNCKHSSKTFNTFMDVSLNLVGNSVSSSIEFFEKPEKLSAGNEWKCDGCNKRVQVCLSFIYSC